MSPRLTIVSLASAAVLCLGAAFAVPALALPGDDNTNCPAGTVLAPVQAPGSTTCTLDSVVRARAKAELLTQDELVKLCADVRVRNLANVRIAVGHPKWEIITLDGKTCGEPKKPVYKDCWTAEQAGYHDIPKSDPRYDRRLDEDNDGIACETKPAPIVPAPAVPAPTPVIVSNHLPVTH
jgi:hypothetical protein